MRKPMMDRTSRFCDCHPDAFLCQKAVLCQRGCEIHLVIATSIILDPKRIP
jgi:hypothetical protein